MGKKSSSPPDIEGAAAVDRETARDITYADRPDQISALGDVRWSTEEGIDPATGEKVTEWTQTNTLNPTLRETLDSTLGMMQGNQELAEGMGGRIEDEMGNAPDWAQFGDVHGFDPDAQRLKAENSAYGRSTARLDPRFASESNAMEIKLRNQGLAPGDQAWDSAMDTFGRRKEDAYSQARLGSTAEGRQEYDVALQGNQRANALRDQQIQEYITKRGFSLGEQKKLSEGSTLQDLTGILTGGES